MLPCISLFICTPLVAPPRPAPHSLLPRACVRYLGNTTSLPTDLLCLLNGGSLRADIALGSITVGGVSESGGHKTMQRVWAVGAAAAAPRVQPHAHTVVGTRRLARSTMIDTICARVPAVCVSGSQHATHTRCDPVPTTSLNTTHHATTRSFQSCHSATPWSSSTSPGCR